MQNSFSDLYNNPKTNRPTSRRTRPVSPRIAKRPAVMKLIKPTKPTKPPWIVKNHPTQLGFNDFTDLYSTYSILIAEYIADNPLLVHSPKFHSILIHDIWTLINDPLTSFEYDVNSIKTMHSILAMANSAYFCAHYPPRAIGGNHDGCYMNEFYSAYPWTTGITRTPNTIEIGRAHV